NIASNSSSITTLTAGLSANGVIVMKDPHFEDANNATAYWTSIVPTAEAAAGVAHYSTASPHSGGYCLRYNAPAGSIYVEEKQNNPCVPGDVYEVDFWTRQTGSTFNPAVGVRLRDASGSVISPAPDSSDSWWRLWNPGSDFPTHGWTKRTIQFTVPDGAYFFS